MLNLGVTGHRHLPKALDVQACVERALLSLEERFPGRPVRLFSSLAEGADRIVARHVLRRPTGSLVAVLPMPRQDYIADFTSSASRDEFSDLAEAAAATVELPLHGSRAACYERAGIYVLDHSDVLIALWDGMPPRGLGGTADIVARATERHVPVLWVNAGRAVAGGADLQWLDAPVRLAEGK